MQLSRLAIVNAGTKADASLVSKIPLCASKSCPQCNVASSATHNSCQRSRIISHSEQGRSTTEDFNGW
jgi:hypothetical protein